MNRLRLVLLLLFAVWLAPLAAAEVPLTRAERTAIAGVVKGQLAAFAKRDARLAFSFASPELQRQFGSADDFMSTVREDFAILIAPRSTTFFSAERVEGEVIQAVRVVGRSGETVVALYTLERQRNGVWRITGCELAPSELQSV